MRIRLLQWTLALVGLAAICHPATAQVVAARWQFADTAGNPITGTPNIPQGTTITWRIYLADQGGTSAPFLNKTVNGTSGLNSAGMLVTSNAPTITAVNSTPAPPGGTPSTTPNITGTPWASVGAVASNNGSTANNIALIYFANTGAAVTADATGRIFMGTYTFSALASGPATLTVNTRPGFTTFTGDGSGLDPSLGSGTANLTVTAVPEPGSMLLCGLGAVGLAAYRRRTRKTAVVEEAAV